MKAVVCERVKVLAKTTHSSTNKILATATSGLETTEKSKLPTKKNFLKTIANERYSDPIEYTVTHNGIPDFLYRTVSNKLLFQDVFTNSMGNKTNIMINELYFSLIAENSIILADGNFKSSPCGYKQVYCFQFFVGKKTYPFFYVYYKEKRKGLRRSILTNKTNC
jgi:hypothetical protein